MNKEINYYLSNLEKDELNRLLNVICQNFPIVKKFILTEIDFGKIEDIFNSYLDKIDNYVLNSEIENFSIKYLYGLVVEFEQIFPKSLKSIILRAKVTRYIFQYVYDNGFIDSKSMSQLFNYFKKLYNQSNYIHLNEIKEDIKTIFIISEKIDLNFNQTLLNYFNKININE